MDDVPAPPAAAPAAAPALTQAQLSKYETPLTRTESLAQSMTDAEALAPVIAERAGAARAAVIARSRETSPVAAPVERPVVTRAAAVELESFCLPESFVVSNHSRGTPSPRPATDSPVSPSLFARAMRIVNADPDDGDAEHANALARFSKESGVSLEHAFEESKRARASPLRGENA